MKITDPVVSHPHFHKRIFWCCHSLKNVLYCGSQTTLLKLKHGWLIFFIYFYIHIQSHTFFWVVHESELEAKTMAATTTSVFVNNFYENIKQCLIFSKIIKKRNPAVSAGNKVTFKAQSGTLTNILVFCASLNAAPAKRQRKKKKRKPAVTTHSKSSWPEGALLLASLFLPA